MIIITLPQHVSFALSEAALNGDLAQSNCVVGPGGDPENPMCARATFNGNWRRVDNDSEEYTTIKAAFFERQPLKKYWPTDHSAYVVPCYSSSYLLCLPLVILRMFSFFSDNSRLVHRRD